MFQANVKRIMLFLFLGIILWVLASFTTTHLHWIIQQAGAIVTWGIIIYKLIDFLTSKIPRLYWFLLQTKLLISNSQVRWKASSSIEFEDLQEDPLRKIWENYLSYKPRTQCIINTSNRLVARINGMETEISFYKDEDRDTYVLHTEVLEYHAPFIDSSKMVGEVLVPYFVDLSKTAKGISHELYAMEVFFEDGKNPFIGKYTQEGRLHDLVSFNCVLKPKFSNGVSGGQVSIAKDKIEFTTSTLTMFGNLAQRYLSAVGA